MNSSSSALPTLKGGCNHVNRATAAVFVNEYSYMVVAIPISTALQPGGDSHDC